MPETETPALVADAPAPSTTTETAPSTPVETSTPVERDGKGRFQTRQKPFEQVAKRADSEKIYAKVRANLDKFIEAGRDDKDKETTPEAESAAKSEPPAAEAKKPGSTEGEPTPHQVEPGLTKPTTEQPATEAAADVTPAPTLPASHVRSLKAFGLTDAEINTTSPEVAAALHARRNQEITRWAEAGRQQQARSQQAPAAPPVPAPQTQSQVPPAQVADIDRLKQTYGADEPLIQHFAAQQAKMDAQEKELADFRTFRQSWQQQQDQQKLASLITDVDKFFSDKERTAYHAVYGTTTVSLSAEQEAKRAEVLRLADAIVGGARQQGVELNIQDALQHAFDSVSAPQAKEAARQEIKGELQKRTKGITLRPGGKPAPKPAVPARAELEARARANLRKVFAG